MISFNSIPLVLTPGVFVEFDTSRMQSGLPVARTRTLILGQKLAGGTAVVNTLYRVTSPAHAKILFGQGSMLAAMFQGYDDNDRTTDYYGMATIDNAAGVAATATAVFAGPATAAGTIDLMVTDQRVQVPVTAGMISTAIATAVAAEINTYLDLPVTASVAASTVTLTARHKGLESNGLFFKENYHPGDQTPAGVTITILGMGAVVAGTGNPSLTTLLAALGDEPFQTIVHPWNDDASLDAIEAAMADRAGALRMNYSEAYTFNPATYSGLITAAASRNSPYAPFAGMKDIPTTPWQVAAAMAAQVAFSAKIDPGRPFNTLVLKNIMPPPVNSRFTRQERELLLEAGVSTLVVNASDQVSIERMVTSYKTNAQGIADTGLRDLNAILLLYYLSWSLQARITMRFPRFKLGNDGGNYQPGQAIVTPNQIKGEIVALATEWEGAALIENLANFISELRVERDATDPNRLNAFIRPDLINGFQVLAALVQPIA